MNIRLKRLLYASDGRSVNNVFVAKLLPDGSVDERFGGDGFVPVNIKNNDSFVDFCIHERTITLICQSARDAPRHFKTGLARIHL